MKSRTVQPKPSIGGVNEAALVSEWTRKRARGERIPIEPPAVSDDGAVTQTSRMGRIDSPTGRRMAAAEAAAAAKEKALAEKLAAKKKAAEDKAAELAKDAPVVPAAAPATTSAVPKQDAATTAPAEAPAISVPAQPAPQPGILGNMRKKITNIFGS